MWRQEVHTLSNPNLSTEKAKLQEKNVLEQETKNHPTREAGPGMGTICVLSLLIERPVPEVRRREWQMSHVRK